MGESRALRAGGRWSSGGRSAGTPPRKEESVAKPPRSGGLETLEGGGGAATREDSGLGGGVGGRASLRAEPGPLAMPRPGRIGGRLTVTRGGSDLFVPRPSLCIFLTGLVLGLTSSPVWSSLPLGPAHTTAPTVLHS